MSFLEPPSLSLNWQNHHSMSIEIEEPSKPNGIITNYTLYLERKCMHTVQCPQECLSEWTLVKTKTLLMEGPYISHHNMVFENLRVYTEYRVTARAENSGNYTSDLSNELYVLTAPSFSGKEEDLKKALNFSLRAGERYVSAQGKPFCPFLGPIFYHFSMSRCYGEQCDYDSYSKTLEYHPRNGKLSLDCTFENLEMDQTYEVCLVIRLEASTYAENKCVSKCVSEKNCQRIKTICTDDPLAKKKLEVIPWDAVINDHNPFSEVKLLVPKDTFEGVSSATEYFLHCKE